MRLQSPYFAKRSFIVSKKKELKAPNKGIIRAIEFAGSQVALAKLLDVAQPAVNHWLYENVPAERALEISEVTGVPANLIRPDLFK